MRRIITETVFILFYITHTYADSWFTINSSVTQNVPQSSASKLNAIQDVKDEPTLASSNYSSTRVTEEFFMSLFSSNEDLPPSSFMENNDPVAAKSATEHSALIVSPKIVTTPMPHTMNLSKRSISTKDQTIKSISGSPLPRAVTSNYSLHHLMEECPNADICFRTATQKSSSSNGECCLSCSCAPRCKLIGNCCDKTIMGNDSMCHSAVVQNTESSYGNADEYFMIDKCLNAWNTTDCKTIESEPWGSLFPVYDAANDLIFYNKHCAECSGVETYKRWNLNIFCHTPYFTNELFLNALQGKSCAISFTPPPQVQLEKHLCSTSLISRCNVTGLWSIYDPWLEEACLRWYSPVTNVKGRLLFSNIYCQRCNGYLRFGFGCSFGSGVKDLSTGNHYALLIDYDKVLTLDREPIQDYNQHALDGQCGKNMVKHPFKMECRSLLCPNGFIRIDGKCEPVSTKWLYQQYFVQLELTSTMKNTLPMSYLDSLSGEERNNPNSWFDAKGAPLDYFIVFVDASENTSFVENLIVRVGRRKYPMNIAKETKSLRKAMSQVWELNINGKTCQFTVKFYKYAKFLYTGEQQRVDVVKLVANETTVEEGKYVKRVSAFATSIYTGLTTSVLRKTNFCERVRLLASEWTGGFQEILLSSSITGNGAEKILGDSEFDIFLDDHGKVVVDICVEDFNKDHRMHTTNDAFPIAYNSHAMLLVVFILSNL